MTFIGDPVAPGDHDALPLPGPGCSTCRGRRVALRAPVTDRTPTAFGSTHCSTVLLGMLAVDRLSRPTATADDADESLVWHPTIGGGAGPLLDCRLKLGDSLSFSGTTMPVRNGRKKKRFREDYLPLMTAHWMPAGSADRVSVENFSGTSANTSTAADWNQC